MMCVCNNYYAMAQAVNSTFESKKCLYLKVVHLSSYPASVIGQLCYYDVGYQCINPLVIILVAP